MDHHPKSRGADPVWYCLDGNEAAARIAYALSEVIAIYPITPASAMGELSDAWSSATRPNIWGAVPEVVEMQSEAGAAGAVHGALQKGALATTFTASQGLLLMLPNMFKIAGELSPAVIHVAARTVATHALSIFGDHSDVMAARTTGWAMLASGSVQEAQDLALIAHSASLSSWIPFVHFFDGFRTSHEVNKIAALDDSVIAALVDENDVRMHRSRALEPERPVLRGSAQNPDVFFQAREASNPFYAAVPEVVAEKMRAFGRLTGRSYGLVDYRGAPDADRVIIVMGSGAGAIEETVEHLNARGEKVGVVIVRLYRPFPMRAFVDSLPSTVQSIAVLDRTKEPGAPGEPLYQDVVVALAEEGSSRPRVVGGRYGLSSKEFTPAMVAGIFEELSKDSPKNHFTVGIVDDVTWTSIDVDPDVSVDYAKVRAVFYGLGSDGTVGASKSSVKIVGENTDLHAQGYFVYDSKKSGSVTISHLRFSMEPIRSTYLIEKANFVACHQFAILDRVDVLGVAERGGTFLLSSPYGPERVWEKLPERVRAAIVEKQLRLYVIDAYRIAHEVGLGTRINTVMQPCFFALSDVLDRESAIAAIKRSIAETYAKRGAEVVDRNLRAVDRSLEELRQVEVPSMSSGNGHRSIVSPEAPDFVQHVTARMLAGEGDLLPVSALPVDGTWPTATSRWEKRSIAQEIPIWDPEICIDCGHCAIVCPHAAVLMKVYEPGFLEGAPEGFRSKSFAAKEASGLQLTIQVAPDDCTGCGVCVDVCPVKSKTEVKRKAINMEPIAPHVERERDSFAFFGGIPYVDRDLLDPSTVKGSQVRAPLFEFSGACAGCGETPYLKLLTQLFGDRLIVANATGCSSIYGGNLPTTPWTVDDAGRGPAWANSLFEDNAEFGFGMRLAADQQTQQARSLLADLAGEVGEELAGTILDFEQTGEAEIAAQRERIGSLRELLSGINGDRRDKAARLDALADSLLPKSVWIVGGDGWAYDIGSAGLDHVLASDRNVNILVLDTEVYSNTGGQASKATPRGAVAKFAARGKRTIKKDLGMIASAYGHVYVAQIALGANYTQTIKAFLEAEAWDGPSLIIAYSTCIAHGIDMRSSMSHQKDAVKSGYWPLYRYHPGRAEHEKPFHLDSRPPSISIRDFAKSEARFAMLARSHPEESERLLDLAQKDIEERWRLYEQTAGVERRITDEPPPEKGEDDGRSDD